jgi:hypothetical protein
VVAGDIVQSLVELAQRRRREIDDLDVRCGLDCH